jgi:ATP-dependent DNA helicase RecG
MGEHIGMSDNPETSVEQIDAWRRSASESQQLEFKEAQSQFEMSRLREYCVALANEGGGRLLLGIADKPPRPVVGTHAFRNVVSTAERLYDGLGFRVEVEEVAHPQGRVLVFHIPSRPRGTAYHLDGRYLMRSGEALVPMSEDRLRSVFSEGRSHWLFGTATHGISAEEVVRTLDTAKYFQLLRLPYPESQHSVLDRLARENLILREPAGYAITNLGVLLLARHLEPFDGIRRKRPRIISYSGKSKVHTNRELAVAGGYAATFEDLIAAVELQTPVREVIERALRRDERMYPLIAIRELIANALIHQDLDVSGATVMVEIYTDRIEISNPGQPGVQPERFIDEYRCRNEPLADLMRRFGICEEKGSGIDKVVQAVEDQHLPAPEFRVDSIRTTCVLHGARAFVEMGRDDRIRACYQHCCLRYVSNEPMTNRSLRERFGLAEHQTAVASHIITATQAVGLIMPDGASTSSKRYARYVPFWA